MFFKERQIEYHVTIESANSSYTETTFNDLSHFITADIFIAAKSSFSTLAAYYNPNCVIFQEHILNGYYNGSNFIFAKDTNTSKKGISDMKTDIRRCVQRTKKHGY